MRPVDIAKSCLPAIIFATTGLIACSGRTETQPSDSATVKWWEPCLQETLKHDDRTLVLTEYKYRGKVKTEAEKQRLLDEIFADDAYTLTYVGKGHVFPAMTTWGEMRKIRSTLPVFQQSIEADIAVGRTDVIDLEWRLRGTPYRSVAIANDNGRLYDNIGTFAIAETVYVEERQCMPQRESFGDYHMPFYLNRDSVTVPFKPPVYMKSVERRSYLDKKVTTH